MHGPWTRWIVAITLLSMLGACSDDDAAEQCGAGERLNPISGACEPVGTDVRDGEDAGADSTSPTDTADSTDPQDTTDADDTSGACIPGERTCVDDWTLGVCDANGTGFDETNCGPSALCRSGQCDIAEGPCDAGERTCRNDTEALVCNADETGFDTQPCSGDQLCYQGTCRELSCLPDSRSCQGDDVVQCNADGTSSQVVETCGAGETCERGACVEDAGPCANQKGYLGCEFMAADLDHMSPGDEQPFGITVSNSHTADVDVTISDGDGTQVDTRTIAPDALETFELPRRDVDNTGKTRQSYIVESTGPVTVHQFNPLSRQGVASTDASLLLPAHALGTDYMMLAWPTTQSGRVTEGRAYITIVAPQDNTDVTVQTSAPIAAGGGVAAMNRGDTRSFTLARGEVLSLSTPNESGHDLSGSTVTSSKPIAVFSGSECADVPVGAAACDHLEQQMIPTDTWGTSYVAARFEPRGDEVNVYRVIANASNTQVTFSPAVDGNSQVTLDAGSVLEFETKTNFEIEATGPVLLGQWMVGASADEVCSGFGCFDSPGDPAFLLNPPTRQYRPSYTFLIPAGFDQNFASIVAPSGAQVSVDGQAVAAAPVAIAGTAWEVYRVALSNGVHRVESDQPVGLTVHGYQTYVSYAYPGGMKLESR